MASNKLSKRIAAVLAVLAAAIALLVWGLRPSDSKEARSAAPAPKGAPSATTASGPASAAPEASREEIVTRSPEPEPADAALEKNISEPKPAAAPLLVEGRVIDVSGGAIAGAKIVESGGKTVRATSGVDGRFRCEARREDVILVAAPGELATLRGCRIDATALQREHLIIVAPAVDLAGVVVDEKGVELADASLSLEIPRDVFAHIDAPLDGSPLMNTSRDSDAHGRFEFTGVPSAPGVFLYVAHDGFEPASHAVPSESRRDLRLELQPRDLLAPHLSGIVLHAEGAPASDALVQLGFDTTKSDEQGRFRIELENWIPPEAPLVAAKRGFQPALVPGFGAVVEAADRHPAPVTLTLGAPSLSIRGRVTREGNACKGWEVALVDGTAVTRNQVPPVLAESLAATKSGRCATDKNGAFEIGGLLEREYRLQAWSNSSLLLVRTDPIAAGRSDVEIKIAPGTVREKLRGQVVTPAGVPLEKVRAQLKLVTVRADFGQSSVDGRSTLTDAQGFFELTEVPRQEIQIEISGETILPTTHDVPPDDDSDLRLVASMRCHFRIDASGSDPLPDSAQLLDEHGEATLVWTFEGRGWGAGIQVLLSEGRSAVRSAAEGRYTLVLQREQKELARIQVELRPGEVQVLRP